MPRSKFHDAITDLVGDYSRNSASLSYLDLAKELCGELASKDLPCPNLSGLQILYRVSNHLTAAGSYHLFPALACAIKDECNFNLLLERSP